MSAPVMSKAPTRIGRRTFLTGSAGVVAGVAAGGLGAMSRTQSARGATSATLQFWHVRYALPHLNQALADFGKAFEQSHPGVQVQIQSFPFEEYFQKITTAFTGNQAPDVFFVDFPEIASYAYRKMIIPLDSMLSPADLDDYYPAPRRDMTFRGHILTVPMHQSTQQLLYNVDVMQQVKVRPPRTLDGQWTWDQFIKVSEMVTRKDAGGHVTRWAYTTVDTPDMYEIQPWVAMAGGEILSPDGKRATGYLNSPATVRGVTFWGELYTKRQFAPVQVTPDLFPTGKAVFVQGNPYLLRDVANRFPKFRVGVTFLPKDQRGATPSGAYHLGISTQTKQQDLAWQFVDSVAGRKGHTKWVTETGYLPARKSAYANLPYLKQYPWSVFWEGLVHQAVSRPSTPAFDYIDDQFSALAKDVQLGQPAKPALDAAATRFDQELAKYN
jgi:fructooligosaccharide transport system substrate-binding protein